jgi:outer membrane protein assembly factor BamB
MLQQFWRILMFSRTYNWTVITLVAAIGLIMAVRPALSAGPADNFASFRGPNGCGNTSIKNLPTSWNEKDGLNIAWRVPLDLPGWGTPIVWGSKVFVTGATQDKRVIYCFDRLNGKSLWKCEVPLAEGAAAGHKLATQDPRWDKLLQAGATPVTDGKRLIVPFSNGQLVAVNLSDGSVAWNKQAGNTTRNIYGWLNSPLIFQNTVIAAFEGKERHIAAYDLATGEQLWKSPRKSPTWASPILFTSPKGTPMVVLTADPDVTAWDARTGKQLWSIDVFKEGPEFCVGPSAVYGGGRIFVNCQNDGIFAIEPDAGTLVWSVTELPDYGIFSDSVSMLTNGRHVFQFFDYYLTCLDAKTGAVIKHKEMLDACSYASPYLNNNSLYLFTDVTTMIVNSDPESDFAVIGKGEIEDTCDGVPALVEGALYFRSDDALYCIMEAKSK